MTLDLSLKTYASSASVRPLIRVFVSVLLVSQEAVVLCLDIGPTMWEAPYQTGRASGSIKLHEACQAFSAFVQQKVRVRPTASRA